MMLKALCHVPVMTALTHITAVKVLTHVICKHLLTSSLPFLYQHARFVWQGFWRVWRPVNFEYIRGMYAWAQYVI